MEEVLRGEGEAEAVDALRKKFKSTPVEFEPHLNTRCITGHVYRRGQYFRVSILFLIPIQRVTNEMKTEDGFRQAPPVEGHLFLTDPILPTLLHRLVSLARDFDLRSIGHHLTGHPQGALTKSDSISST